MKKVYIQMEGLFVQAVRKKKEGALKKTDGVDEVNILFNASKAKIYFVKQRLMWKNFRNNSRPGI